MMDSFTLIDTGMASARQNMELDSKLLKELDPFSLTPILHLYDWNRVSATYGHFIHPSDYFSEEGLSKSVLEIAQRPTGGGVIFHNTDWAFSLLIPSNHPSYSMNTLENYAFVNTLVIEVIKRFVGKAATFNLLQEETKPVDLYCSRFCMAKPTKYDVMLNGKKISGGAQRRTKAGYLHQGTISLTLPNPEFLGEVLCPNPHLHQQLIENTCPLLHGMTTSKDLYEARLLLRELFKTQLGALNLNLRV